ncbi:MAG: hypothetical protein ACK56I_18245, partial [bacterium]
CEHEHDVGAIVFHFVQEHVIDDGCCHDAHVAQRERLRRNENLHLPHVLLVPVCPMQWPRRRRNHLPLHVHNSEIVVAYSDNAAATRLGLATVTHGVSV